MKFSIIIPCLNEASGISTCLQALQSLRPQAEIIVVDGGSDDKTVKQAQAWADKVIQTSKGRGRQMNAGAAVAKGELLIFLHADTFLPDNALETLAERMTTTPYWGRFDIQLIGQHRLLKVIAWFMNQRSRLTHIATGDQVIFVDKTSFESVGGYLDIALMEDITLTSQLKQIHAPDCLFLKVKSSGRRWEKFGILKTILLMWSLRFRYWCGQSPQRLAALYFNGRYF